MTTPSKQLLCLTIYDFKSREENPDFEMALVDNRLSSCFHSWLFLREQTNVLDLQRYILAIVIDLDNQELLNSFERNLTQIRAFIKLPSKLFSPSSNWWGFSASREPRRSWFSETSFLATIGEHQILYKDFATLLKHQVSCSYDDKQGGIMLGYTVRRMVKKTSWMLIAALMFSCQSSIKIVHHSRTQELRFHMFHFLNALLHEGYKDKTEKPSYTAVNYENTRMSVEYNSVEFKQCQEFSKTQTVMWNEGWMYNE